MTKIRHNITSKQRRKLRVSSKMFGTEQRPRLSVLRSNQHIALQVIDDQRQQTLAASSDIGKKAALKGTKLEKAQAVAKTLSAKLKKQNINKLAFDRGYYRYHGRVKAIADTLRQEGINI